MKKKHFFKKILRTFGPARCSFTLETTTRAWDVIFTQIRFYFNTKQSSSRDWIYDELSVAALHHSLKGGGTPPALNKIVNGCTKTLIEDEAREPRVSAVI